MSTVTIVVGRKHIPLSQVALVEPFDPAAHPGMRSDKAFKARIVLTDRQSVLTEDTVEDFAEAHGFRLIAQDQVVTNPAVRFSVESFVKAEGFEPTKPFASRLLWRDLDGNTQSKLLLSPPDAVLAIAVTGDAAPDATGEPPREGGGRKRTASSMRPGSQRRRRRQAREEPVPF